MGELVVRQMAMISGVTFREAVKYLPEPKRSALRAVMAVKTLHFPSEIIPDFRRGNLHLGIWYGGGQGGYLE